MTLEERSSTLKCRIWSSHPAVDVSTTFRRIGTNTCDKFHFIKPFFTVHDWCSIGDRHLQCFTCAIWVYNSECSLFDVRCEKEFAIDLIAGYSYVSIWKNSVVNEEHDSSRNRKRTTISFENEFMPLTSSECYIFWRGEIDLKDGRNNWLIFCTFFTKAS